jgi:murein DD-endopeptidase MepM/ murein hydrolase activator NlpD
LLIIRHKNGLLTAYAHTKEILVKKGQKVKLGQVVAKVGQSGNVQTPQVHFGIRDGKKPIDPVKKVRS